MPRQEPKVLLLYPPNQLMDIEVPRPDGSLGLLYLAGALRDHGIEVKVLDASVGSDEDSLDDTFYRRVKQPNGLTRIGMTPDRIRDFVANGNYDIVGISSIFTPQTRMVIETARAIKKADPRVLVISGGVNAQALASRLLATGAIDLITNTESEKLIVQIVRAWQQGDDFSSLAAVTRLTDEKLIRSPVAPSTTYDDLDCLPYPAWDLLPFAKYEIMNAPHGSITPGKVRRYAPIMTSRGCPFRCAYCHISEERSLAGPRGNIGLLRLKSIDRVMMEINHLRSLNVTHLFIEDDSLLAKKARVTDLFRRIAGMGMKISNVNGVNLVHFGIRTSDGCLTPDRKYLELMKAAGFDEIVFPVESGNQRILDTYASSKLNLEQFNVLELVRAATNVGIVCPVNMMIGFPDETENEMLQSVALAKQLVEAGAAYVSFFIPIPFPGSQLFTQAIAGGYLSEDFDPDEMNWKNASMKNTTVPPERIIEIRDRAWDEVNTDSYKRSRIEREIRSRIAQ